jgi:hypothetical protein
MNDPLSGIFNLLGGLGRPPTMNLNQPQNHTNANNQPSGTNPRIVTSHTATFNLNQPNLRARNQQANHVVGMNSRGV